MWEIVEANATWGRVRTAYQLRVLGVFVAPSTVRNILTRSKPPPENSAQPSDVQPSSPAETRSIPASYPNHVWSVDLTTVMRWGLWPIDVLVAIDHFSRKLVCVQPLRGPSADSICKALREAFALVGPPKHLISDQQSGFDSAYVASFLKPFGVKQRFGAIGKFGNCRHRAPEQDTEGGMASASGAHPRP